MRGDKTASPAVDPPTVTRLHGEHDIRVIAGSDWVIDIGPGAGEEGGRIVAAGPPATVAQTAESRTAPYPARALGL